MTFQTYRTAGGTTIPRGVSSGRRALDVVVAGSALVLLSPLLLLLAVVVRLSGPGPVVFRQRRITTGGREFTIYKFRTMRTDGVGPSVTRSGDARVTRPGRFMRRTSLDELPQLVNVLRGEMTLVGPRPETPDLAARYPAEAQWVLELTPGVTGPAQISMRDDVALQGSDVDVESWYLGNVVPRRVAVDLTFLARPTVAATVGVLARTARYLVTGRRWVPPTG